MDFSSAKKRKEIASALLLALRTESLPHQVSKCMKVLTASQEVSKKEDLDEAMEWLAHNLPKKEKELMLQKFSDLKIWLGGQDQSSLTQYLGQMEQFSDTQSVRSESSQKQLRALLAVRMKLDSDQKVSPVDQKEVEKALVKSYVTEKVKKAKASKPTLMTSSELEKGDVTIEFLLNLAADLTYLSFDVAAMRQHLRDQMSFKQLMVCLVAYVKAGNNYTHSLSKGRKKAETASAVQALLGRLQVVSKKTGVESVTLSRIAICFPHILLWLRSELQKGGKLEDRFPGTCNPVNQDFALAVFFSEDASYLKFHATFSMVLAQAGTDARKKAMDFSAMETESRSWIRVAVTGLASDPELKEAITKQISSVDGARAAFVKTS
jgi:hypothetical protein